MNKQSGFTLLEILIAVALIGILTAIAIPSYQNHIFRTYRTDAQSALRQLANAMERYYSKNSAGMSYVGASLTGETAIMPQWIPRDASEITAAYQLQILDGTATTFVIAAVPVAGGVMDRDADLCGAFLLSNTGQQWNDSEAISTTPLTVAPVDQRAEVVNCW